jgi:hypothetical protein
MSSNGPIDGLDDTCGVCTRVVGDHTMRQWAVCIGTVSTNLPYEAAQENLRQSFGLDSDMIVADHVVVHAAVLGGESPGGIAIRLPALYHEFQVGRPGGPPVTVAKVVYIGSDEGIRGYGRLIDDSAVGAADAAA